MKNINNLIFILNIFGTCHLIHSSEKIYSIHHYRRSCHAMDTMFMYDSLNLEKMQSLLTCKSCRRNAFANLCNRFENLGNEKSKKIAELFLQNGIDVNDLDEFGRLPIQLAVDLFDTDAINCFISLNADVNKKDRHGYTALMRVIKKGFGIKHSSHKRSNRNNQLNIVRILLEAGANPNICMPNNIANLSDDYTALLAATSRNLNDIVYLLLTHGANPWITNMYGKNFFDYAENRPLVLEIYKKYKNSEQYKKHKQSMRKIIYETVSKKEGFHEDMPNELVNMINEFSSLP